MQEPRKITITIDLDEMEYESTEELLSALDAALLLTYGRREELVAHKPTSGLDRMITRALLDSVRHAAGTIETITELVTRAIDTHSEEEA